MHCDVHTQARTHVPSRAHLVRALARSPARRQHRPGRGSAAGGGTHRYFRLGQSAAAGSAASSVLDADLRARARRAASARHYARPGRPRPPARARACTRGSAGRNRPPHTHTEHPGLSARAPASRWAGLILRQARWQAPRPAGPPPAPPALGRQACAAGGAQKAAGDAQKAAGPAEPRRAPSLRPALLRWCGLDSAAVP